MMIWSAVIADRFFFEPLVQIYVGPRQGGCGGEEGENSGENVLFALGEIVIPLHHVSIKVDFSRKPVRLPGLLVHFPYLRRESVAATDGAWRPTAGFLTGRTTRRSNSACPVLSLSRRFM